MVTAQCGQRPLPPSYLTVPAATGWGERVTTIKSTATVSFDAESDLPVEAAVPSRSLSASGQLGSELVNPRIPLALPHRQQHRFGRRCEGRIVDRVQCELLEQLHTSALNSVAGSHERHIQVIAHTRDAPQRWVVWRNDDRQPVSDELDERVVPLVLDELEDLQCAHK